MDSYLLDWVNLLLRWLHVIVGIAWIGASFYFVFLDFSLKPPTDPALKAKGVENILIIVPPPVRGSTWQEKSVVVSAALASRVLRLCLHLSSTPSLQLEPGRPQLCHQGDRPG